MDRGRVAGTIELLARSLRRGGIILIGEPYWLRVPPSEEVAVGCGAGSIADFQVLPGLVASFGRLGYDVVEMVLTNQDGWDRYEAAKWLTMRRWLEASALCRTLPIWRHDDNQVRPPSAPGNHQPP